MSYHKQYKTCRLCQETFKISKTLAQETPEMLSATEILSDSTVKRLVVK